MPAPRATTARLIAPRVSLASCVRAHIVRSTVGVPLTTDERYNYFPATPSCIITWFIQGTSERSSTGQRLPGPIVFRGPHTIPTITYNPGPVQMFMMLVMPDALRAMTGIDAGQHVNRLSAAQDVFDAAWLSMLSSALGAPDDAARVQLIEEFIDPRWQAARRDAWGYARNYRDWTRALAMRAAMSGLGRSVRQVERRVRAWAGLPLRTLHGLSRAERSFFGALDADARGRLNWAEVAADAGYADQSHLCRESRRITGLSPRELMRRMQEQEGFWVYRIWR
ncbi:MAG: AraC family transcriptional regulator [Candidatus Rokubacteria bacterium]|nr:AraC family transcriptional regulator [Candidatus Rokubacteria bacterium]